MPKLTSIIIPIYNTDFPLCHYTGFCIGNIREFTDKEKTPYEIIIVDNGSTVELGGWKWDQVVDQYHRFNENKGFAAGMNQGYKMAKGDYICFMSNDVFAYDHWLEDFQEALEHVGAVNACPMYDMPWGRALEAAKRRAEWLSDTNPDHYLVAAPDFSLMMTTRKIIEEVGLLDENFGLGYSEDVDWRIRLEQKGYQIKADKRVNTLHLGGATRYELEKQGTNFAELMNKNKDYLIKKHGIDKDGVPAWRRNEP